MRPGRAYRHHEDERAGKSAATDRLPLPAAGEPPLHALAIFAGALIVVLLALEWAQLEAALRYERAAIAAGEWWRLISGHFVHLGWRHTLLNGAGLALTMMLVGDRLRPRDWLLATAIVAPAISAGLWLLRPELQWYVGLSAVLHALVTAGALLALASRESPTRLFGAGLSGLVALKLAWEQAFGAVAASVASSGGPVAVDAHLLGALAGSVWAAGWVAWRAGRHAGASRRGCFRSRRARARDRAIARLDVQPPKHGGAGHGQRGGHQDAEQAAEYAPE